MYRSRRAKAIALIAFEFLKDLREEEQKYEARCQREHKQGYRPSQCPHGMNLRVDWDVICGPCEDFISLRHEALKLAHEYQSEVDALSEAHKTFSRLGLPIAGSVMNEALMTVMARYGYCDMRENALAVLIRARNTREIVES